MTCKGVSCVLKYVLRRVVVISRASSILGYVPIGYLGLIRRLKREIVNFTFEFVELHLFL